MYRVVSPIVHTRSFIYFRPAIDIHVKTLTKNTPNQKYQKVTEREICPPPPPPTPPPPKDDRLLWGAITMLVLAGGFAVFAKQNPEIRDWLSLHAAWFDEVIAILYQENMTYKEYAQKCVDCFKKCVKNYLSEPKPKPKQCSLDGNSKDFEGPDQPIETPKKKCPEKKKCEVQPPPDDKKSLCEIDECLKILGDSIINNYFTAGEACAYYNKVAEEFLVDFDLQSLKEIHDAKAERIDLVQTSVSNITDSNRQLDDIIRYIDTGVSAPKEKLAKARDVLNNYQDQIKAARIRYEWENDKSVALDAQIIKVEELLMKYTDENQTLFSGLRYDQKKPVLHGDADLLLYHTLRYVSKLRAQLAEATEAMTERVDRAMDTLPQTERELKNRNYIYQSELKKRRSIMDKDYKRRANDQKVNNDRILKEALKNQAERHEENLKVKLIQKEKEAKVKLDKMVADKVAAEKKVFADGLAEMSAKLKVVEDKLNARIKAEKETRRSQELWAAGASLLAATKKGDSVVKVDKEIKAIEKASTDEDKLVQTVLKGIPETVRSTGVVPESVLKQRYYRMEKVALAVALVESEGGPMPMFIMSWLQSLLLFMRLSCIPQKEVDNPPVEPFTDFDTFDLLQRARYYMERGNVATAYRYVGSLQGASRSAASTWHEAARSYLETRQAAEAVIAHAVALGLQYIS